MKNFFQDMSPKKIFIIFLIIHVVVCSAIGLIRTVLPTDALEGIYWGGLHDFGTPKHPPLSGWIGYLVYSIFKTDFSIYLVSQLFIVCGLYFIYKIARQFLDENRSMLVAITMGGCWAYSYVTGYYGFNPDVILLCMLPLITYIFYECIYKNRPSDWIKLGIFVGISFLNKYQTVLVLLAMFIWTLIYKREVFKNKFFYISVIIAFLIFTPHLIWLIKYDFFPLLYFESEFSDSALIRHIIAPLKFLIVQISAVAGTILIYSLLKIRQKSAFKLFCVNNEKTWFLILFGLTPLVIHLCMGIFGGGTMRPRWGFEFLYMTSIMLFYFLPTNEISKEDFKFTFKLSLCALFLVFLSLGTLLAVEKNYRSRYPVSTVYGGMVARWNESQNRPLKYIGGYIEWTLPLTIYGDKHEDIILDTNGYKNPWIDEEDLKRTGILIIDRTIRELKIDTKKSCPYLDNDYEITPVEYRFFVKNALNMPREYTIYYTIIPPYTSENKEE